jgi:hypothetical protein
VGHGRRAAIGGGGPTCGARDVGPVATIMRSAG